MSRENEGRMELVEEMWRFESRADGVYVAIEEIGGQGELGPFPDRDAARRGLAAYLRDELPESALPKLLRP